MFDDIIFKSDLFHKQFFITLFRIDKRISMYTDKKKLPMLLLFVNEY